MSTMSELFSNARESLKEDVSYELSKNKYDDAAEFENDFDLHDLIFSICDSSVPVYTSHLLELASDNISLAVDTPELGPAFDGSPTPANIIAANVFEAIEQDLFEYWEELKDDEELFPTEDDN